MTRKVFNDALEHLRKQPRLASLALRERKPPFSRPSDPFESLIRSIIYQQLSGKAASTILARLLANFSNSRYPTPKELLKLSGAKFRKAGVSAQKMKYLRDLAGRFLDGTIDPSKFNKMTDEEIREHLIVVKGVGRWTADMFLMFTLYRPDVLPTGDLGIQKGFQKLFKLKTLPDAKKMEKLAKDWSPYRTIACWYLWELVDTPN
jgi:DNA-3-methyladenine glycosylase II